MKGKQELTKEKDRAEQRLIMWKPLLDCQESVYPGCPEYSTSGGPGKRICLSQESGTLS